MKSLSARWWKYGMRTGYPHHNKFTFEIFLRGMPIKANPAEILKSSPALVNGLQSDHPENRVARSRTCEIWVDKYFPLKREARKYYPTAHHELTKKAA